ncbi:MULTISPECIES: ATP-binding protein [unclassified Acidovorax]|uniref:sensor histidine kinase n=1 Tax=unclassified Acidovorax TaxID=2684926 RepID=UPI002882E500|nr:MULTISPECIES: ATP-binding protein [unclassified Acidovorax]
MTDQRAGAGLTAGDYAGLDAEALRALLAARDRELADGAAAQEEFIRAVSHDLRAPLRHITSYGPLVRELLEAEDAGLPADARDEALAFLNTMDQSARRMGRMLDGLMELSRAARAPIDPAPVDLTALVGEAQAALNGAAAGRTIEWSVATEGITLHADAALLRQLLVELLGNAIKFTAGPAAPGAASSAHIAIRADALPNGGVVLQVQDNGSGFDAARAGSLFGVFQRLHRDADYAGVGCGLATARIIVQRHGGRIGITGERGAGCTVMVEWPAPDAIL